jgi:hypothetical protein
MELPHHSSVVAHLKRHGFTYWTGDHYHATVETGGQNTKVTYSQAPRHLFNDLRTVQSRTNRKTNPIGALVSHGVVGIRG